MKRGERMGRIGAYLVFGFLFLLSSCGKEEVYQPELGVDGYVYPAKMILDLNMLQGDLKVAGDYLYYAQNGERGVEISRLPISSIRAMADGQKAQKAEVQKAEVLYTVRDRRTEIPDYIKEQLSARVLPGEEEDGQSMWVVTDDGDRVDISKNHCMLSFRDFNIDEEGNLYCWQDVLVGNHFDLTSIGGTLSRRDSSGETVYQVYYPDMLGFELCAGGGACILGEGRVVLVDGSGARIGEASTEQYRGEGRPLYERLLRDAEGHIYYLLSNYSSVEYGLEVLWEDGVQLEEMGGSFCDAVANERSRASAEHRIFTGGYSDFLYEYNVEDGSQREVLNWTESGLLTMDIRSFARISPEELAVYYGYSYGTEGLYLLTRTAVADLPEMETIVIFSYAPTDQLKDAVMRFNRESDAYRIVIDDYGAEYSWVTKEGSAPQVDLAVVSRTPPDLLDMTFLDLHTYADKGVLEDLAPYLEGSAVLDRGEFLENALEGVTLDGRLTCIPHSFEAEWLLGRKSQMEDLEAWSMEDVYRFSEKHPESVHRLIYDFDGYIEKRDYLLNTFCSYYCLEEFVDLEKGESRFEDERFVRLLKWAQEYAGDNSGERIGIPDGYVYIDKDASLVNWTHLDFGIMTYVAACWGDETVLRGFPSADGKGAYPVYIRDALAITTGSPHKEGAWEFMEYFLSSKKFKSTLWFPTKKEWLIEEAETAVHPWYYEDEEEGIVTFADIEGDRVPVYALTQEQADSMMEAIESADFTPRTEKEKMILRIISEEAESYYNGDKSIEEVIRIIQSRVNLLLQEG